MTITDLIKGMMKRDDDFKIAEKELKIQKTLETRQKNSNERELERFMEEERQEHIKQQLEMYRKKKQKELWSGGNMMKTKNIFQGHKSILTNDMNILKNDDSFLGRGNMIR